MKFWEIIIAVFSIALFIFSLRLNIARKAAIYENIKQLQEIVFDAGLIPAGCDYKWVDGIIKERGKEIE